ncbi:MAG: hypothetical protein Q7S84_02270 [bacterium]|nr:hypothetical protein [bacterium]
MKSEPGYQPGPEGSNRAEGVVREFISVDGIHEDVVVVAHRIFCLIEKKYSNESGEIWQKPAELDKIVDYWDNFDDETKQLMMSVIPELAACILSRKLHRLVANK